MKECIIVPPDGTEVLVDINCRRVCANAKYTFDHPLHWQVTDQIIMRNGQFFLLRNGEEILIDGRWTVVSS